MSSVKRTGLLQYHANDLMRSLTYSLGNSPILDCEDDPENLALTNECRRLLLEAGADPTSITEWSDGRRYSFIYRLLGVSTMVCMNI